MDHGNPLRMEINQGAWAEKWLGRTTSPKRPISSPQLPAGILADIVNPTGNALLDKELVHVRL